MFDFAETTKDMTASEILNYYRNLYYAESQVTERGIVANAINDFFSEKIGEVEMLQGALKAEERHNELTMQIAQKALQKAKSEIAKEIFDEIEKLVSTNKKTVACATYEETIFYIEDFIEDLAELKKKYTGEKEDADA